MQLAWSRIWTRVAVSISYDDNYYTTGTSNCGIDVLIDPATLSSNKITIISRVKLFKIIWNIFED